MTDKGELPADSARREAVRAPSSPRRPWHAPRVADHGSMREFVRSLSGEGDDGLPTSGRMRPMGMEGP